MLSIFPGSVIGLHMSGDGIVSLSQELVTELMKGTTGLVFVSQSSEAASAQVESFFNFADMQMGIWCCLLLSYSV